MAGIRRIESTLMQMGESEGVESNESLMRRIKEMLPEIGMLRISVPGIKDIWSHTKKVICNLPQDTTLRWAALYHDIGKPSVYVNDYGSQFANHEQASASIWVARGKSLDMCERKVLSISSIILLHMRVQQYDTAWSNKALKRMAEESNGQIERTVRLAMADGMPYSKANALLERMKKWKK